jgi:tellurite resistance protein
MDVLKSISYVKAKPLTDERAILMEELREAVEEMKLIKAVKKKARNAEDFLNDL